MVLAKLPQHPKLKKKPRRGAGAKALLAGDKRLISSEPLSALQRRVSALADDRRGPLVQELAEVVTTLEIEVKFKGAWPPA